MFTASCPQSSPAGDLKSIFGGDRSYADRKTSSACVGDSKVRESGMSATTLLMDDDDDDAPPFQDLPDVIETWEEDQHYPELDTPSPKKKQLDHQEEGGITFAIPKLEVMSEAAEMEKAAAGETKEDVEGEVRKDPAGGDK